MTEAGTPTAVAMEFPVSSPGESPPRKAPRRLVERLSESRNPPSSVEEIEAKLRDADLRRQKFHEWLSSKARPRVRSLSWSSQEEDLGRRLEAKLYAAEQKRLSLLQRAQTRLAKLDELRQAAKNGAVQRSEREREELGTKVKSKIQQAEVNRMLLLKTHLQRRADAQERKSQSLMKRAHKENKYKECVQRAIFQKRVAAERKRSTFLEAEKTRAGAKVMRAHRIASSVYHQREIQRRKLREQMEARLSRAKRQRAEHLKQRRNSICSSNFVFNKMRKNGDSLSRKLARCWRQFVRSKKTTFALAKAYEALGINREHVKNMPFEQLAARIGSPATLESVKSLLERFESCLFLLSRSSSSSALENIDHLLKRVSSPTKTSKPNKMPRYPVRVALCAYMIFGHPEAVFSGRGKRETELADKGAAFLQEFELLTSVALKGPRSLTSPSKVERVTFRSQLAAFDSAWRSYLYSFVVWKVKDAKLLEEDLVRTACQMELSMMRKCKLSHEGEREDLNHDLRAIQTQVIEDQQLLRDKVKHLSGSAGVARMESAIAKTRSKYFEKKQGGSSSLTPISQISSQSMPINRSSDSSTVFLNSTEQYRVSHSTKSSQVVRALFKEETLNSQSSPQENEVLVNEMLHQVNRDKSASNVTEEGKIKERIKETMEKAFWDGVTESLLKEKPDYRTLINLVKEVKDELSGMSPKSWKEEINGCIDLDILSQVLDSRGDNDLSYLREVMEYALGVLVKLSAPAKEDEMKKSHEKFLSELAVLVSQSTDKRNASLTTVVRGLRFVLEQIRDLKEEISRAQIQMMEPILRGPPGIEYLQKAFSKRYGPPSEARSSLPLTSQWISSFTEDCASVWEQHTSLISPRTAQSQVLLPPATSIRSGGRLPGLYGSHTSLPSSSSPNSADVPPECKGERVDLMLRLGLLKLASKIDGLTEEITPETFQLNWRRLRNSQSQIQNTIVICTSLLVLRQTLISQALPLAEVEPIISLAAANLSHLIDHNPDVALSEILSSLMSSLMQPQENLSQTAQLMGQMLSKSLQADDPIFMKVSSAIHLATRTLLLGGTTATTPAAAALQRVGSAMLLGRLTVVAESLATMAVISGKVHGAWYAVLVNR